MLTEEDCFHLFPSRLAVLVLLLALAVGRAGAQQDSETAQAEEPETGQASQADPGQRTEDKVFEPSEKISADDAVSFPVDI